MHLLFLRASDLFFAENMIEGMHQFRKKAIAVHKTEKKTTTTTAATNTLSSGLAPDGKEMYFDLKRTCRAIGLLIKTQCHDCH